MSAQLRRVLLLLALLNLVFVQITGAVSPLWMAPLFGLALAAPLLWPLQRLLTYRLLWNAVLLAIFCLLLFHVQRYGVRHMLEDGLILAAFCQVHVLNNLARQGRPDLIFFNSFLIALVTGFFCQDPGLSAVFLVYATVLVIGLRLAAAASVDLRPTRTLPKAELRALVRGSLSLSAVVLLCTGLVFAFWPRDFQREGLVETDLVSGAASEVAFADEIRLDRSTNATRTNRIVMRARLEQGTPRDVPAYWRGATFSTLHRRGWWADTNPQRTGGLLGTPQLDPPWDRRSVGRFERTGHETVAALDVELSEPRIQNLFVPLHAHWIEFDCTAWPMVDGNFRVTGVPRQHVRFRFEVHEEGHERWDGDRPGNEFRGIPRRIVPDEARELSEEVDRVLGARARSQRETVDAIRSYLTEQREYFLPGESGAVDNVRDFLAGRGGGHCEFFATTMVILLRLRGIPCRMVGGYLVHEWNEEGTEVIVRSDDAHAWVEVWDEKLGWLTVDPTPASDGLTAREPSLLTRARDALRGMWSAVTQFDEKAREALLAWTKARFADTSAWVAANPVRCALAVLGLFLLRPLLRRRRRRDDAAVRAYLAVLQHLRLDLRPGETPRQLLARAAVLELPAGSLEQLRAATAAHEGARYGAG